MVSPDSPIGVTPVGSTFVKAGGGTSGKDDSPPSRWMSATFWQRPGMWNSTRSGLG